MLFWIHFLHIIELFVIFGAAILFSTASILVPGYLILEKEEWFYKTIGIIWWFLVFCFLIAGATFTG